MAFTSLCPKKIQNVLSNSNVQRRKGANKGQGLEVLQALKKPFNEGWKGYAGFRFINKNKQGEIDLLIVTHCNLLIVELKHWNGKPVTSSNVNGTGVMKTEVNLLLKSLEIKSFC